MARKLLDQDKELVAFLERLGFARIGVNNYTRIDRARDFIATFRESESGRRVFAQICAMCDPHLGPNDPNMATKAIWNAAQRHVLAQILQAFAVPEEDLTDVSD